MSEASSPEPQPPPPPGPQPAGPQPSQPQPPPVVPPRDPARRPSRVEPVPETRYGLAIFDSPPETSGPAVGALVTGIASVLVAIVVGCLGLGGAVAASRDGAAGSGALAAGAFAVLAGFLGLAGVGLGIVGVRQTRAAAQPPGGRVRGRGVAIAGVVCGAVGVTIAVCSLGVAVLATVS